MGMKEGLTKEVKQFRLNYNLTLEEVAKITGVSKSTLGRIEQGIANPNKSTVDKILDNINEYIFEKILSGEVEGYKETLSAEEFDKIVKFNEYFLNIINYTLELTNRGFEVWNNPEYEHYQGIRVDIIELYNIMVRMISHYENLIIKEFSLKSSEKDSWYYKNIDSKRDEDIEALYEDRYNIDFIDQKKD